ncbi:MAG: 4a-hydroxytetrahydrobiopterin dehydratase [Bdellovibrionales bacterium]|nr:4a-hydroxytetrahydrobiopterin dehydratase [Bdellovibrionales bacterium]
MSSCDLTKQKCVPCEGGVEAFSVEKSRQWLEKVPGWTLQGNKIEKTFKFKNFVEAMAFVNRMADIAEAEGHHPDISIHYSQVTVTLWTHAIGGLSENDFILAAKIEAI